jgi:hypothetical protein
VVVENKLRSIIIGVFSARLAPDLPLNKLTEISTNSV